MASSTSPPTGVLPIAPNATPAQLAILAKCLPKKRRSEALSGSVVVAGHNAAVKYAKYGIIHRGTRRRESVETVTSKASTASAPCVEPIEPQVPASPAPAVDTAVVQEEIPQVSTLEQFPLFAAIVLLACQTLVQIFFCKAISLLFCGVQGTHDIILDRIANGTTEGLDTAAKVAITVAAAHVWAGLLWLLASYIFNQLDYMGSLVSVVFGYVGSIVSCGFGYTGSIVSFGFGWLTYACLAKAAVVRR
ncbi:hypothetical protein HDU96_004993, partial [Phlyctochytrium bullatum]